ncbi:UPF0104 family protein [Methanobrevibacter curvatus]|uniref:Lysylphosphatidylglycerol synthase n=1 Tax=Methanobrevibacter curvatus TaxID=49547 RepID=A0A166A7H7_9EURY|nr:UPF0104 family protein [Methanobrevibacter curvatus]KZX11671.1 hypothetical protein MBCUR_13450 [Methanobrevibacter curvatus]
MKYKNLIFLGIGILILAVMIYFIGFEEILNALKLADPLYIILAILVQIITYYLFALRWKIINKIAHINISIRNLIPMVLIGMAINNITPSGRGGGEPIKAYLLSKETEKSFESTFATVIADRALDSIPFLVLAIMTIILMVISFKISQWIIVLLIAGVVIVTIAFILLIYMSLNKKIAEKVIKFILRIIRIFYKKDKGILEKKITDAIEGFQKTMNLMLKDKDVRYIALPLSFVIWISEIIRVYLIFLAFGSVASPIIIAEVFIVSTLVGMIPLLPGGLGVVDGMMILLFSAGGISPQISAVATVIERLISFWMTTIIGLILLPYYGYSITEKLSTSSDYEETDPINNFLDEEEAIDKIFEEKK